MTRTLVRTVSLYVDVATPAEAVQAVNNLNDKLEDLSLRLPYMTIVLPDPEDQWDDATPEEAA